VGIVLACPIAPDFQIKELMTGWLPEDASQGGDVEHGFTIEIV